MNLWTQVSAVQGIDGGGAQVSMVFFGPLTVINPGYNLKADLNNAADDPHPFMATINHY